MTARDFIKRQVNRPTARASDGDFVYIAIDVADIKRE
jgi:hypothetical protein